jgi:hypothetical protein
MTCSKPWLAPGTDHQFARTNSSTSAVTGLGGRALAALAMARCIVVRLLERPGIRRAAHTQLHGRRFGYRGFREYASEALDPRIGQPTSLIDSR